MEACFEGKLGVRRARARNAKVRPLERRCMGGGQLKRLSRVQVRKAKWLASLWLECDMEKGPSVWKEHGREATASTGEPAVVLESENGVSGSGL